MISQNPPETDPYTTATAIVRVLPSANLWQDRIEPPLSTPRHIAPESAPQRDSVFASPGDAREPEMRITDCLASPEAWETNGAIRMSAFRRFTSAPDPGTDAPGIIVDYRC